MRRPILALSLLVLVGCKHPAPPLKAAAPPDLGNSGWTTAFDKESGASIAIPSGWRMGVARTLDASSLMGGSGDVAAVGGPAQEMGAQLLKDDAAAEKRELATMREKQGIVLHCTDGSKPTPAEEPTRIYVKRMPDAGYSTLEEAAVAEKQDTHRDAKTTIVDLPVGKAARLVAQGQNRIGDQECHVSYVFLDGPNAYALRFASTNNPQAILGIEKDVARTFRVAKK